MMTAKQRRLAETAETEIFGSPEPTELSKDFYKLDLMKALNYYNVAYEDKIKKKWVLDYYKKTNPDLCINLEHVSEWKFNTLGPLCKMLSNGITLQESSLLWINKKLESIIKIPEIIKEETKDKPKFNIQNRMLELAHEFAGLLDSHIDNYLLNTIKLPDLAGLLKTNHISKPIANHIPSFYNNQIKELQEVLVGGDEQLLEGYRGIPLARIKTTLNYLLELKNIINIHSIYERVKTIRVKKQKPPSVLVKSLKYKKDDVNLGLVSINPINIVGSSNIWIYDTKYHKLAYYSGSNISVKGTTLTNFEPEKSMIKSIRKPETIKDYVNISNKKLEMVFKELKTKVNIPTGRINPNCIILKVS